MDKQERMGAINILGHSEISSTNKSWVFWADQKVLTAQDTQIAEKTQTVIFSLPNRLSEGPLIFIVGHQSESTVHVEKKKVSHLSCFDMNLCSAS